MKRFISLATGMAFTASVFALKIPSGDNVRAADVKQNGNAIVEVTLGGENAEITTPIGKVQAKAGSVVYFYDKGALKELKTIEQDVPVPIGIVKVKDGGKMTFYESGAVQTATLAEQDVQLPPLKTKAAEGMDMIFSENGKVKTLYFSLDEHKIATPLGDILLKKSYRDFISHIDYYESGSPKTLYVKAYEEITVGGTEYFCYGYDGDDEFYPIEFYDSGSSDKWLVKSLLPGCYRKDETDVVSVAYESKIGKIEIALNPYRSRDPVRITFDKDGNVLSAPLYKSPDFTVKVNGEDVYIKGGEYEKDYWNEYGKTKRDTLCSISFYDNASTIKSCVLDDLVITEVGGIKFKMPAGTEVSLWENGNVKQCYTNESTTLKIGGKEIKVAAKCNYLFHRNGKFWAVDLKDGFADTFYDNGKAKRIINNCNVYSNSAKDTSFVQAFYAPDGYIRKVDDEGIITTYWTGGFDGFAYNVVSYFQPSDLGCNVAMVFFDDNDNPSSYTMLKLDKDGNYMLDDEGIPIEDPVKKKFRKR